jgi:hypothetical protein
MKRTIALCCVTALAIAGLVPAYGAAKHLFTGKDIKNHSLTGKDIKKNSLPMGVLSKSVRKKINARTIGNSNTPASQGEQGLRGPQGAPGQNGAPGANGAAAVGQHWGPIDRNIIKSAVADLRNGPFVPGAHGSPPFGSGSLGLETADNTEKAAFGNEVDFVGDPVSGLDQVGFQVYTTGENNTKGTPNMPSIVIEIDPNMNSTASNFSSMVYQPQTNSTANQWSDYLDATTGSVWFLTGAAGTATGCTQASLCTLSEVKAALAADNNGTAASILSVGVTKGRDFEFQGAVDGLRINNQVFDFELFGVVTRTP